MRLEPDIYNNKDLVAHYTTGESCLNILESKELWLTQKQKTLDPFEYAFGTEEFFRLFSQSRDSFDPSYFEGPRKSSLELARFCRSIRQTSFCRTIISKKKDYYAQKDFDGYCFLHQRMWEQYASNYAGFCLVFSLSKLKESNKSIRFINVKYKKIGELNRIISRKEFDADQYHEDSHYLSKEKKKIIDRSLYKSLDYRDENEIRAIGIAENESVDHLVLSIKDALKGIAFFPDYSLTKSLNPRISELVQRRIIEIAKIKKIKVVLLDYENGININLLEKKEKQQADILYEISEILKKHD